VKLACLLGVVLAGLGGARAAPPVVPAQPGALAVGPNGNVYIADDGRDQILVRRSDGSFAVVAGTGRSGYSGDGGPALRARLGRPQGMAFARDGTLYFADSKNNRIRAISPAGRISTVVGNGRFGWIETGTRARSASLAEPSDVKLTKEGGLVIAAVQEVVESSPRGRLTRLVGRRDADGVRGLGGPATEASADAPDGVAIDGSGNLFVAGFATKALLVVTRDGTLRLVSDAFYPRGDAGLAGDANGSVFGIETTRIVRVTTARVQTVIDFARRRIPGLRGGFLPHGIAVAPSGDVYVDAFGGNGWGDRSMLLVVHPAGGFQVLWAAPR
jgi:hypothetical protein